MRFLLIGIIQLYWYFIPEKKRRNCIFKTSCSHFVFNQTRDNGFISGLIALNQRIKKCRPGYKVIRDETQFLRLQLSDGSYLAKEEVSEGFIEREGMNLILSH